ncbi:MAG: DUF616 domain-containing protein [Ileibacterium sp.]|nr:DUF616 domain-containing protein [Ileibacterium sp.]
MNYKAVEQLEKEKQEILNSPAYRKGAALLRYKKMIRERDFKKLKKELSDYKAAKVIRKNYLNHKDRPQTDCNRVDYTKPRIAVYTCVLGGYDKIARPLCHFDNVDFLLFTDHPQDYQEYADDYQIIGLEADLLSKGNILANRYLKFHPAEFMKDYDYAIYMDGNVRSVGEIRSMINRIPDQTGIAMHNHRERDDIYSEAQACRLLRRGDPEKIAAQMERYRQAGFPEHYGMNEATVICSDLKNKTSIELLDAWWDEFIQSESYRDQLAWPFVLYQNGIPVEAVGNLGNNIYENPKVEMMRHA